MHLCGPPVSIDPPVAVRARRSVVLSAAAVVIVLAGMACIPLFKSGLQRHAGQLESADAEVSAEQRSLVESIEATGRLSARSTVTVGSEVSGEIARVLVDFNDIVSKGQVIAEINPSRYQADARSAEASVNAAHSRVARARIAAGTLARELDRTRQLEQRKLVSRSTLDQLADRYNEAGSSIQEAIAEERRLRAARERAQYELDQTVIRSPVDGVVLERLIERGQTVAASFETPAMFRIAEDLSEMIIELSVDEADIGAIQSGREVEFEVSAFPGRQFRGTIIQRRVAPRIQGNNATYPVIVAVGNADRVLVPGMLADARIIIKRRNGVLSLPSAALAEQSPAQVVPAAVIVKAALESSIPQLRLSNAQSQAFREVVRGLNLTPQPGAGGPGSVDPALSAFFGPMASKVVVIDEDTEDPAVAMRRQRHRMILNAFSDLKRELAPSASARLDEFLADVVNARQAAVYVREGKRMVKRTVLTGLEDGAFVQIVSGLSSSDRVATAGNPPQ